MSENKVETSREKNKLMIMFIVMNGLIVGGYLPFLLVEEGNPVTAQVVGVTMLSVAGSEAVLLVVLGLPLIVLISKTKLKDLFAKIRL